MTIFNLSQMLTSVGPVRVNTMVNVTWMVALTGVNAQGTGTDTCATVSERCPMNVTVNEKGFMDSHVA